MASRALLLLLATILAIPAPSNATLGPKVAFKKVGTTIRTDGDAHLRILANVFDLSKEVKDLYSRVAKANEVNPDPSKRPRLFSYLARAAKDGIEFSHLVERFGIHLHLGGAEDSFVKMKDVWDPPPPIAVSPITPDQVKEIAGGSKSTHNIICDSGWDETIDHIRSLKNNTYHHTYDNGTVFFDAFDVTGLGTLTEQIVLAKTMMEDLTAGRVTSNLVSMRNLERCHTTLKKLVRSASPYAKVVPTAASTMIGREFSLVAKEKGEIVVVIHMSYVTLLQKYDIYKVHSSLIHSEWGLFGMVLPEGKLLAVSSNGDKTFFSVDERDFGSKVLYRLLFDERIITFQLLILTLIPSPV